SRLFIAPKAFARERLIHDAKDWLTQILQTDKRSPQRQAEYERARAVNGIERPNVIRAFVDGAKLLPGDPMIWKAARQDIAHGVFGAAIGNRYGVESAPPLVIGGRPRAKMRKRYFAGSVRETVSGFEESLK